MIPLPQPKFDVFALALPRGHAFGNQPPCEAWPSHDAQAFGAITRNDDSGMFGMIALRRRVDQVWVVTSQEDDIGSFDAARARLEALLVEGADPAPLPDDVSPRPALYDVQGREPSEIFRSLTYPSYHVAAWMLNQLHLSLPNRDRNWAGDCHTANFHTRLWQPQLLASFREQGLLTTQPFPSPDYRIANRQGGKAWVEAVTANPAIPYEHVNAPLVSTAGRSRGIADRAGGGAVRQDDRQQARAPI